MWQSSPEFPALEDGRIDVWRVPLADESHNWTGVTAHLSADEQQRAASFRFPQGQRCFARSRGVLRDLLGRYCDLSAGQLELAYSPKGKPELTGPAGACGVQFNVSHSGDLALIAVSRLRPLGVDVERFRAGVAILEIARRYFSTCEVDDLVSLPIEERPDAFFRCWTRKEALVKGLGLGVSFGLSSFSVSLSTGVQQALVEPPTGLDSAWQIRDLPLDEGYAGAVAFQQPELARVSLWDWPPQPRR